MNALSDDSFPLDVYADNIELALSKLAHRLRAGSLALMLGAGVSSGIGLPSWWKLVKACCDAVACHSDDIDDKMSNETLRGRIDDVARMAGASYLQVVSDCLHGHVEYTDTIIQKPLLIALGALMMGSRRGRIRNVVTFNFDDVLEWYLDLHGFTTQVVDAIPALLREEDLLVYHQHGFLPKNIDVYDRSLDIVFSQMSYDIRMSDAGKPWKELLEGILRSHVGLFVGLSGDDPILGPTLASTRIALNGSRETGFWLFRREGAKQDAARRQRMIDRNIIPLFFDSFDDIPRFLLDLCKKAAELSKFPK